MQIPVLIVGAGPAGLCSSIVLSRLGVSSLLVERHPSTSIHPKATGISTPP
jgi:putative polyketide hydroxylase